MKEKNIIDIRYIHGCFVSVDLETGKILDIKKEEKDNIKTNINNQNCQIDSFDLYQQIRYKEFSDNE